MLIALVSGCATIKGDSYCDLTSNIMFDKKDTVDHLLANDRNLLKNIVAHNEMRKATCSDN